MDAIETLTDSDQKRLVALEAAVDQGAAAMRDMAVALREIRDSRLYRQSHTSFDAYCKDRFSFSRQWAYDLIGLADVADRCQPLVDIPVQSERQARLLRKRLPIDKQGPAWAHAVALADGKVPTNAQLGESIKKFSRDEVAERVAAELGVTPEQVIRDAKYSEAVDLLAEILGRHARRRILLGQSGLTKDGIIELATKNNDEIRGWYSALPTETHATPEARQQAEIVFLVDAVDDIAANVGGDAKDVLLDDRNGISDMREILPIWCSDEVDTQQKFVAELRTKIATAKPVTASGGHGFECAPDEHDWSGKDDIGRFCKICQKPYGIEDEPSDEFVLPEQHEPVKRLGVGVIKANEVIDILKAIPKNDKLRKRAWEIVRDWMDANE